ncbi:GntR family transcriptional regulator [Dysgonomonas massiliensis]|uniref:GntR family transcriptional regulator n=1 Tax=Dysgonomonas massiliensis TaxID=2040292 RepID=UPI000C7595DA|nr:GntR family transcriptional regulator [Dysgonomonas massiliensis]
MDFKSNKPIYMQIVDFCFDRVLENEWKPAERIPSVRELGVQLQVNPNTVMRAYEYMQTEEIIYPKRGMGYYVEELASKRIRSIRKKEFFEEILPVTFHTMDSLEISIEEITEKYNNFKKTEK